MQLAYLVSVFVSGMPGFCHPAASMGHKICQTLKAKQTNKQQNTQLAPQKRPFSSISKCIEHSSDTSSLPANQNVAVFVLWRRVFESCRDGMRMWRHTSENTNTAVLRTPPPHTHTLPPTAIITSWPSSLGWRRKGWRGKKKKK